MKKNLVVLLLIGALTVAACEKAELPEGLQTEHVGEMNGSETEVTERLEETEAKEETELKEETEEIEEAEETEYSGQTALPMESTEGEDGKEVEETEKTGGQEIIYSVKESQDKAMLNGMEQKSHDFVACQNEVYYREYNEKSFSPGKTNEWYDDYVTEPDVESKMMCVGEDGTVRELFRDKGSGDIYIQDGRFYMMELSEKEDTQCWHVYSVDMNGKDRRDYGEGWIVGADAENHVLLYEWTDDSSYMTTINGMYDNKIFKINTLSGETEQILSDYVKSNFLLLEDGTVYFGVPSGQKRKDNYPEKLYSLSLVDGSSKELAEICGEDGIDLRIRKLKISGNKAYFSYGCYTGSARGWYGGCMGMAMLDGSGYRIFYAQDYPDEISSIFGEEFYVLNAEEDLIVLEGGKEALKPQTGETVGTDFPPQVVRGTGIPFYWEEKGSVCVLPDNTGTIVEIAGSFEDKIPSELWKELGGEYEFENMGYANGDLYFTISKGVFDSEYDVGWRSGVRRVCTLVFRLAAGEEKAQLLYRY